MEIDLRQAALAKYLGVKYPDLEDEDYKHYGLAVYSYGRAEYAVGTDSEADDAVREYIESSVWAFNSDFLACEIGIPELAEVIGGYAEQKCESANDALLALVEKTCGLDSLVESAVSADGRGHFLGQYDSEENEETLKGEYWYIYRIN